MSPGSPASHQRDGERKLPTLRRPMIILQVLSDQLSWSRARGRPHAEDRRLTAQTNSTAARVSDVTYLTQGTGCRIQTHWYL